MMLGPVSIPAGWKLVRMRTELRSACRYLDYAKERPSAVTPIGIERATDYVARLKSEIARREAAKGGA